MLSRARGSGGPASRRGCLGLVEGGDGPVEVFAPQEGTLNALRALTRGATGSRKFTPFGDYTHATVSVVWIYTDSRASRVSDSNR